MIDPADAPPGVIPEPEPETDEQRAERERVERDIRALHEQARAQEPESVDYIRAALVFGTGRPRDDLAPHLVEALDHRADQCRDFGLTPTWRDEVQFVEGWRAAARLPEAREVASLLNAHADGRPEATDATIRAAVSDLLHALGVEG